jgi:alkanesulfonate monooxygenase SsuD/methylene tetrahydromethanopterin reductase-like flavin-dependent oxidoreductase (luciferase family)
LFGYNLQDYDELFSEKLEMLLQLNDSEIFSWKGRHTQTIHHAVFYPPPYQKKLPLWIGVGGTPESVIRAAEYGLPMALAIMADLPCAISHRMFSFIKMFMQKQGMIRKEMQLGINSHTYIADDSQRQEMNFILPILM